ncbi:MAG: transcription elongation factor GreA [Candidatus Omnitrophota bacterium]
MDAANSYLTPEGHRKLVEELEQLKTVRRRQISKEIEKARGHGDISENAEYDAAKDAQAHNEAKISELEFKLAHASIIDNASMSNDEVLIGAKVMLKDMDTDEELEYTLVSEMEADYAQGKISISSPVGKGLMNRKAGEVVEIKIPAGTLKYKILKISR